ncbi:MAG: hypothetical protein V9G24_11300 [Rhodoblastus sp.]
MREGEDFPRAVRPADRHRGAAFEREGVADAGERARVEFDGEPRAAIEARDGTRSEIVERFADGRGRGKRQQGIES